MEKITVCEIFNQVDDKYYTLYVKWFNSYLKIMLLESKILPLIGEMNTKSINDFSNELSKSFDEYFTETKKILCGEDTEIKYFIKNKILEWRNNTWILGKIELHSISDIQVMCENFQQLLKFYQSIQNKITILEEKNKNLICINETLNLKIEKMIEIKTTMEQDLYKKFIVLLNSKKKKIKKLENTIKEKESSKKSIFDVCTDESEESEKDETENYISILSTSKQKYFINDKPQKIQKNKKTDNISDDKIIYEASSSKDYSNNFSFKKSRSSLTFIEEESDNELFL
ncbi:DNA repair protein xrcc4-like [Apis dorsata]|uniref:DNA repair protein xrcc4-like n=1 Tax=Apis dorsata TaxID=7462 RepID=UPI0003DF809F|nr:DNA repair protein xrcc4-like [Apis dorsata]